MATILIPRGAPRASFGAADAARAANPQADAAQAAMAEALRQKALASAARAQFDAQAESALGEVGAMLEETPEGGEALAREALRERLEAAQAAAGEGLGESARAELAWHAARALERMLPVGAHMARAAALKQQRTQILDTVAAAEEAGDASGAQRRLDGAFEAGLLDAAQWRARRGRIGPNIERAQALRALGNDPAAFSLALERGEFAQLEASDRAALRARARLETGRLQLDTLSSLWQRMAEGDVVSPEEIRGLAQAGRLSPLLAAHAARESGLFPEAQPADTATGGLSSPLHTGFSAAPREGSKAPIAPPSKEKSAPAELLFDGKTLRLVVDGKTVKETAAWSGREGWQDKAHQYLSDKGPIPEGEYRLGQLQRNRRRREDSKWEGLLQKGRIKFFGGDDEFSGARDAWGDSRVYLHPVDPKQTKGRFGFFLHGGDRSQSAGCINVRQAMAELLPWIDRYNTDGRLRLRVKYPDRAESAP